MRKSLAVMSLSFIALMVSGCGGDSVVVAEPLRGWDGQEVDETSATTAPSAIPFEDEAKPAPEDLEMWVATVDLAAGLPMIETEWDAGILKRTTVPGADVPADPIVDLESIHGLVVLADIPSGSALDASMFFDFATRREFLVAEVDIPVGANLFMLVDSEDTRREVSPPADAPPDDAVEPSFAAEDTYSVAISAIPAGSVLVEEMFGPKPYKDALQEAFFAMSELDALPAENSSFASGLLIEYRLENDEIRSAIETVIVPALETHGFTATSSQLRWRYGQCAEAVITVTGDRTFKVDLVDKCD